MLDTNVVLDWLVFGDPDGSTLGAAIVAGEVRWIATTAMRDELAHVLGRGHLDPCWHPDSAVVWGAWDRHCESVATLPALAATGRLHCSDPDDQKFIDLAVRAPARWLLSRDRAVLKLSPQLLAIGVQVTTPQHWRRERASMASRASAGSHEGI